MGRLPALAPWYMLIQGLAGVAWWVLVLVAPARRDWFTAPGAPDTTLFAFWFPDLVFLVVGSPLVAFGLWRARPWARKALLFVAGGVTYASLYCIFLTIHTGGAWGASVAMVPALFGTLACVAATR